MCEPALDRGSGAFDAWVREVQGLHDVSSSLEMQLFEIVLSRGVRR